MLEDIDKLRRAARTVREATNMTHYIYIHGMTAFDARKYKGRKLCYAYRY